MKWLSILCCMAGMAGQVCSAQQKVQIQPKSGISMGSLVADCLQASDAAAHRKIVWMPVQTYQRQGKVLRVVAPAVVFVAEYAPGTNGTEGVRLRCETSLSARDSTGKVYRQFTYEEQGGLAVSAALAYAALLSQVDMSVLGRDGMQTAAFPPFTEAGKPLASELTLLANDACGVRLCRVPVTVSIIFETDDPMQGAAFDLRIAHINTGKELLNVHDKVDMKVKLPVQ
jgi:hypothetical protein